MLFALVMTVFSYFSQAHTSTTLLSPVPDDTLSPQILGTSTNPTPSPLPTDSPVAAPSSTPLALNIIASSQSPSPPNTPFTTTEPAIMPSPTIQNTAEPTPSALPSASQAKTNGPTPINTVTPSASPTPSVSPTTKPLTASEIDTLFTEYGQKYGVDKDQLKRIAKCESGLNPKATNLYYGGLFQFSAGSWKEYRRLMGKGTDPDLRFDPEAAINTAAYLISTGHASAWPNCK